jgi:lipopolysaccharide export system permease protein
MNKLTIYVAKTVLVTTIIVAVALMSIFIIITFLTQAGDIGEGNYSTLDAFLYVIYQVPGNLYFILPMSALIGCLMGLGLLANNSELIVMRAAGYSIFQISRGVLLAGAIIAIFAFILGAYIAPLTSKQAEFNRTVATDDSSTIIANTSEELWLKDRNDFIHVNKSMLTGDLSNIVRYNFKDGQLTNTTTAKTADYKDSQWQMEDVTSTTLSKTKITNQHTSAAIWDSLVPPKLLKVIGVNTRYLTIGSLIEYIQYNKSNHQDTQRTELSLWQIIFQPLTVIVLMMVAVPFIFGPMRSSAMGFKFILGLMLGFVFFIINQFFGPLTLVYNLPPFLGAALPFMLFVIALVLLFWRMRE